MRDLQTENDMKTLIAQLEYAVERFDGKTTITKIDLVILRRALLAMQKGM
jgi:hypothetical protein